MIFKNIQHLYFEFEKNTAASIRKVLKISMTIQTLEGFPVLQLDLKN